MFVSRLQHCNSLISLFPGGLATVKSQAQMIVRLAQEHEVGKSYNNVALNPDRDSLFSHVEFTEDTVRLEFKTAKDPQYRRLAEIKTGFVDPIGNSDEIISDVRNFDFCGGGAVVVLDRTKLFEQLKENLKNHQTLLAAREDNGGFTPAKAEIVNRSVEDNNDDAEVCEVDDDTFKALSEAKELSFDEEIDLDVSGEKVIMAKRKKQRQTVELKVVENDSNHEEHTQ